MRKTERTKEEGGGGKGEGGGGGGGGRIPFVRRTAEGRDGGGDQIEFGFWPLFRFLVGCLV